LLPAVAETPGIRRVRFMTSHPNDLDAETIAAMDSIPQLCEHLHLPAQSGSTRILKAMRRTYTREEYLAKIEMVRSVSRPISITTDVIVGFPGETEQDFDDTLSLLDEVQFDGIFAFQYSPRPHTPAATMAGGIPEDEKSRRLTILLEKQRIIQTARNESLVGQTFEVLVEGASRHQYQWSGRTSGNRTLNFTSPRPGLLGEYVLATVTQAGANSLSGVHLV
jgi:tRNA-2-methylthio-N6-dimethylallyladenosine synthase